MQPRACGQSLYWSVSGLYDIFRMSSHAGSSSIWASRMRASWSKAWSVAFGVDMFVDGTMITASNQAKTLAPWHERCLLELAIKSLGVVCLLNRWTMGCRGCLRTCASSAVQSHILLTQLMGGCGGVTARAQSWSIRSVRDKLCTPQFIVGEHGRLGKLNHRSGAVVDVDAV